MSKELSVSDNGFIRKVTASQQLSAVFGTAAPSCYHAVKEVKGDIVGQHSLCSACADYKAVSVGFCLRQGGEGRGRYSEIMVSESSVNIYEDIFPFHALPHLPRTFRQPFIMHGICQFSLLAEALLLCTAKSIANCQMLFGFSIS